MQNNGLVCGTKKEIFQMNLMNERQSGTKDNAEEQEKR